MRLILNEENFIKDIINTNEIPKDLSKTYLITLLAKYLRVASDSEVSLSNKIKEQMLKFNFELVEYQEYKWSKKILSVCRKIISDDLELRKLESIPLFQSELDNIQSLKNDKDKKVLFVMYIIARFMNCDGWVNISIKDIFKHANISTTIDKQNDILRSLMEYGYVSTSKKNDNLNLRVELSDETDDIVMNVYNFEKLGNQFLAWNKPNIAMCVGIKIDKYGKEYVCGKLIKIKGTTDKYCSQCKVQMQKKWQRESMSRFRSEKCEVS